MKKILTLAVALLFPIISFGASSVPKTNTATVDVDKVTGNYTSFRWVWPGYSAQSCTFTFTQGSTALDLTGYSGLFKVVKKTNSGQTAYIALTNSDITISVSNATFTIPYTNIPPDGEYQAEFYVYQTASPANTRTLAQGKVVAIDSLYAHDDSTYPWPTNQAALTGYVPITRTITVGGETQTLSSNLVFALADTTYTNYLSGDTEIVVTGAARSGSNVLSLASTITRDSELAAYLPLAGTTMVSGATISWPASLFYSAALGETSGDGLRWGQANSLVAGGLMLGHFAGQSWGASDGGIAIGNLAMQYATPISGSLALGQASAQNASNCSEVIVIGNSAGSGSFHSSTQTLVIGRNAAINAHHNNQSMLIGTDVAGNMTNSHYMIALGWDAGLNTANSSNSVFIGRAAGANVSRPNTLIIDSDPNSADTTNALIYGEFDNKLFKINGSLNVTNGITEGGTALSSKYAPKTMTWPMDCNATLLPTNVMPWVVASWGPFDSDVTLTKLYGKVMVGSETAMVHVCEMATNATTYTTNNSVTATTAGVYDTSFGDSTLGAGNTLFFLLDGTAYSPLASNINVHIDGTRTYVNP